MNIKTQKVKARRREDGLIELLSPGVGHFREAAASGNLLGPGQTLGSLETLGEVIALTVPKGAGGKVVETHEHQRVPVEFGQTLIVLDPESAGVAVQEEAAATVGSGGLAFVSPMSGRFYARPSPDQPPFVAVGEVVEEGRALALLEVMKTFNRIPYGGEDLPARARVKRVVVEDGADVEAGDVLFELEGA